MPLYTTVCSGNSGRSYTRLSCEGTWNRVAFPIEGQELGMLYLFSDSTFHLRLSPTLWEFRRVLLGWGREDSEGPGQVSSDI